MAGLILVDGPTATLSQQDRVCKALQRVGLKLYHGRYPRGKDRSPEWLLTIILMARRYDVIIHRSWLARVAVPMQRMLERVALSTRTVGALCVPLQGESWYVRQQFNTILKCPTAINYVPWNSKFEATSKMVSKLVLIPSERALMSTL